MHSIFSGQAPLDTQNPSSYTHTVKKEVLIKKSKVIMTDYTKFYGFSENPFDDSPDHKFFFPSESHSEALASLLYGINYRKGFVLILGEAGIGKTTLIHHLINTLNAKVKILFFPQSQIPFEQMLKEMLLKLKLSPRSETKGSMMHELYYYLIRCMEQDENVAVIIDEAENIGMDVIEEVRLLANLETSTSKLLQIVLVGQSEIAEKLHSDVIRQIKQRIVIRCQIKPLTEEESMRYIDHRLKIAGSGCSEVFTDEALSLICLYAKGIPLTLNTLCANALSVGHSLSEKRISPSTVKKIQSEKEILTTEKAEILVSGFKRTLFRKVSYVLPAFAIFVMALFFGWGYLQSIVDTPKPNHSVTMPAIRDNIKASHPQAMPHGVNASIPGSPGSDVIDASPETSQIPASPPATTSHYNTEVRVKEIIEVKKGAMLYSLAYKYYHASNETLIDHILKFNPEITNPNLILVSQKIKIPEITESSLIVQSSESLYKVHLRTFANLKSAAQYRLNVALMGKEIEIAHWKISPGETWYRVMIGPFASKDEGLKFIEEIKKKGFSIIPSKAEKS
jgi:general secretion pathway protein A